MNGAENEWGIHSSHLQPAPTAIPEERLLLHWAHPAEDVYDCVRHSQVRAADLSHLTCWAWDLPIWLLLSIVSLSLQLAHGQSCTAIALWDPTCLMCFSITEKRIWRQGLLQTLCTHLLLQKVQTSKVSALKWFLKGPSCCLPWKWRKLSHFQKQLR